MTTATAGESALSARLRSETAELHKAAETSAFQRALVAGAVSREQYVAWLGQMFLLHRALERPLKAARQADPRIARVVEEWQLQEPYLKADLEFFGVEAEQVKATGATARAAEEIGRCAGDGATLLGMHYVLEGSNNGSSYIARAVRKSLGLTRWDMSAPGAGGDRYLEPYGDLQRARWGAFKEALDSCAWSAEEAGRILGGAKTMFTLVARIGEDIR